MYLTYSDYTAMGGAVAEAAFTRFEFRAEKIIDLYTYGRLQTFIEQPETVKMCMFELISTIQQSDGVTGVISSERIGDYSVNYASDIASAVNVAVINLVETYLANEKTADGVPLLYMGVST